MQLLPKDSDLGWTPYAWLVYLVPFLVTPAFMSTNLTTRWAATIVATAIFLVLYFRGYWGQGKDLILVMVAITLLGVICWPWSPGAGAFFIYAAAFAGHLEPSRRAIVAMAIITGVIVIEAIAFRVNIINASWPVIFTSL